MAVGKLADLADKSFEVFCNLQKAKLVMNTLKEAYFGEVFEDKEAEKTFRAVNFDNIETGIDVINDYLHEAFITIQTLETEINALCNYKE